MSIQKAGTSGFSGCLEPSSIRSRLPRRREQTSMWCSWTLPTPLAQSLTTSSGLPLTTSGGLHRAFTGLIKAYFQDVQLCLTTNLTSQNLSPPKLVLYGCYDSYKRKWRWLGWRSSRTGRGASSSPRGSCQTNGSSQAMRPFQLSQRNLWKPWVCGTVLPSKTQSM